MAFERSEDSRRDSFRSQGSSGRGAQNSGHQENRNKKPTDFGPSFDFDTENFPDSGSLSPTNSGRVDEYSGSRSNRVNSPNNPFSPDFEGQEATAAATAVANSPAPMPPPPRPPARSISSFTDHSTPAPPLPKRKSIPNQLPMPMSSPNPNQSSSFSGQIIGSGKQEPVSDDAPPPIPLPSRKKSGPLDRKVSFDQSVNQAPAEPREERFDPFNVNFVPSMSTNQESSGWTTVSSGQESTEWKSMSLSDQAKTSTPVNSSSGLEQFGSRTMFSTIRGSEEYPNFIPSGEHGNVDLLVVSKSSEDKKADKAAIENKESNLSRITETSEGDSSVFIDQEHPKDGVNADRSGFSDAFTTPPRPSNLSRTDDSGDHTDVSNSATTDSDNTKGKPPPPFSHFGEDHKSPPERDIFRPKDPFADDDFFS